MLRHSCQCKDLEGFVLKMPGFDIKFKIDFSCSVHMSIKFSIITTTWPRKPGFFFEVVFQSSERAGERVERLWWWWPACPIKFLEITWPCVSTIFLKPNKMAKTWRYFKYGRGKGMGCFFFGCGISRFDHINSGLLGGCVVVVLPQNDHFQCQWSWWWWSRRSWWSCWKRSCHRINKILHSPHSLVLFIPLASK